MENLLEGYRKFRETYWVEHQDVFAALATSGQNPRIMVVACVDSRVDPQMIFEARPGDLLVLRNVANLVPPYAPNTDYHGTSAALEFAVNILKVDHILVLGHAQCGGVRALLDAPHAGDFIGSWMSIAASARTHALAAAPDDPHETQRICEHEAIHVSLANLMTFPWIKERVIAGTLKLHGWYFDIESGELELL